MKSRFTSKSTLSSQDLRTAASKHDTIHLMVDVQVGCITHLSLQGAKAYLDRMANTIESLRQLGIPTLWIAIGKIM